MTARNDVGFGPLDVDLDDIHPGHREALHDRVEHLDAHLLGTSGGHIVVGEATHRVVARVLVVRQAKMGFARGGSQGFGHDPDIVEAISLDIAAQVDPLA